MIHAPKLCSSRRYAASSNYKTLSTHLGLSIYHHTFFAERYQSTCFLNSAIKIPISLDLPPAFSFLQYCAFYFTCIYDDLMNFDFDSFHVGWTSYVQRERCDDYGFGYEYCTGIWAQNDVYGDCLTNNDPPGTRNLGAF